MNTLSRITLPFFLLFPFALRGQTDEQLRDPEYLVEQYNQLVAKHNALIEKTRTLISQKQQSPQFDMIEDSADKLKLNQAVAKVATLEGELSRIKQEEMRTSTSNQYLDDTNARLRRQLQELKADEQELVVRNKELTAENRRLSNEMRSADAEDKSQYSKIRNLELETATVQRRSKSILAENKTLLGTNKTLSAANESLENEVAVLRQKLGMLDVDKETNEARLRDLNAILTSKDNQLASFENVEVELKEDLNQARNEITRLTGTEKLLNDRIAALKTEEELNGHRLLHLVK